MLLVVPASVGRSGLSGRRRARRLIHHASKHHFILTKAQAADSGGEKSGACCALRRCAEDKGQGRSWADSMSRARALHENSRKRHYGNKSPPTAGFSFARNLLNYKGYYHILSGRAMANFFLRGFPSCHILSCHDTIRLDSSHSGLDR